MTSDASAMARAGVIVTALGDVAMFVLPGIVVIGIAIGFGFIAHWAGLAPLA